MNDVLSRLTTAFANRYRLDRELGAGGMATVYLRNAYTGGGQFDLTRDGTLV